jgi:flagellar hook-basal body complex protein FliE
MSDLRIGGAAGPATESPAAGSSSTAGTGTGFGEILQKSLSAVNSQDQEAEKMIAGLVSGRHANIHETMLAIEKANISFRLLTKIQNKVISAYEEIQRLQL